MTREPGQGSHDAQRVRDTQEQRARSTADAGAGRAFAVLESVTARALRGLPPRSAPSGLAARVRAELARRAARPWWRRSFAHWPSVVRGAFVVTCAGLIALSVLGGARWIAAARLARVARVSIARLPWAGPLGALWNALVDLGTAVRGAVPTLWLDAGATLLALAYTLLLALAVAACRALQARHSQHSQP